VSDAGFPFVFTVTADDNCRVAHEPAALPGGYIFVPAGLLLAAGDEAEFAGMLAHSMEHVAQRHGIRQDAQARVGSVPLIFMGALTASCSGAAAIPISFLETLRNAELEADALAVQTMARAGFEPAALVRFVSRVQKDTSTRFSSMPAREQRVATMRSVIEKLPEQEFAAGPMVDFVAAKEEVRRLAGQRAPSPVPPSLFNKYPR
jgi:predicted Zn-dependent protease